MVQILGAQKPSRGQKSSLSPIYPYHSSRQENFSFQPSVNCSHPAEIIMHLSIHDFPYKKNYMKTYLSVNLNAQTFFLQIRVTTHSWWNFKTGPIPPYVHWHFNTSLFNNLYRKAWPVTRANFWFLRRALSKSFLCCFVPYKPFLVFSSNPCNVKK